MRPLTVVLALALMTGCHSRPGTADPTVSEVGVIVENQFAGQLRIYLESNGRGARLGEINLGETRSYVVPYQRLSSDGLMSLRGEVVGSGQPVRTGTFSVSPGGMVRWTITPRLSMSYFAVY